MAMVYKLGYNIPKKEINKRVFEYPKLIAQIQALTADKDEQAGRIMQMEEALRQTKTVINDLMACNEISKVADVRGEEAIKAIEALLGGKEDA